MNILALSSEVVVEPRRVEWGHRTLLKSYSSRVCLDGTGITE
jgi:hypothetical protein